MKSKEITVLDQEIHINKNYCVSLTDIARYKNSEAPAASLKIDWGAGMPDKSNPNFNVVEIDRFKKEDGHN